MLEVTDDYTPGLSDYKVGTVEAVDDGGTGNLTMRLESESKWKRAGKFELGDEEEEDDQMIMNWKSMYEPKRMKTTK
jgi:hypothetical protein